MKLTLLALTLLCSSCQTTKPDLNLKFWAGDSKSASIERSQDQLAIACQSPAFDDYVCVSYDDLRKLIEFTMTCKPVN